MSSRVRFAGRRQPTKSLPASSAFVDGSQTHETSKRAKARTAMTTSTDLSYTPATELGRLIRAKQISPVEIARAVLERIEGLNPTLHAFLTVTADHARKLAQAAEARAG